MASFNYPGTIDSGTPATASEVQTNFDAVLAWIQDNLIQKDGSVSMTGPLSLAPGAPASPDQAANKAYVDATIPIGVIWEYGGTLLPTNWLWCNGNTYTNASRPALAAAIGRSFTADSVPVGSFSVPNKQGKVSIGVDPTDATLTIGKTGGQRNWENIQHLHVVPVHGHTATAAATAHPVHSHTIGHDHGSVNSSTHGNHNHGVQPDPNMGVGLVITAYGPGGLAGSGSQAWIEGKAFFGDGQHYHSITVPPIGGFSGNSGTEAHTVTATVADKIAFNTENNGTVTNLTDKNLPPYVAVNYIIYAGA